MPGSERALAPDAADGVRRLDWRFLLPEPCLGRVVYLGPARDSLAAALRTLCGCLARVEPGGDVAADRAGEFDLAVVQAPRRAALDAARALLRPGGLLYCEVERAPGALRADPRRLLREAGFREPRAHWHHPDFESCRRMVPLGHPATAACAAAAAGSRGTRAVREALRWADRAGLLVRMVPCLSLVARTAGGEEAP